MINFYKKCEKNELNPKGVIKIESIQDIENPFLLCLTTQENIDNSVFGIIKEGARAARVRTSDELAGGFKIDDMPFDFIGVKYNEEDGVFQSIDDFIISILTKYRDIDMMKKQARKINFFTYCNATQIYVELEKRIVNYMLNNGFSHEEINSILSQITLVSVGSKVNISKVIATSIQFKDANDYELYDSNSKLALKKMEQFGRDSYVGYLNSNNNALLYAYNGTGEHYLREYLKDINIVKSSLCAAIVKIIENSIENNNKNELVPISIKELLKTILQNNGEFVDVKELLDKLDSSINYGNVYRYNIEEHNKLCQIEDYYRNEYINNEQQSQIKK